MTEPLHPYAVYTTEEAARLLKVSVATIQRYIRDTKLQATQIGKWYRVSGQALIDFMSLSREDVATSIQRVRVMEDAIYRRSVSHLMSIPQGKEYLDLFDLTAQTLIALLNPNYNPSDDEMTIKYIGARVFNHAMVAYRNAASGYYQTSYTIQRDLLEISFLTDYFRSYPKKVREWKSATNEERLRNFSPSSLYKALDSRDRFTEQKRKTMYQQYCEYASHVSYPGIRLLTNDQNLVQFGPFYDEKKLLNTIHDLCRNFGALVSYLGTHIKIRDAQTATLVMKHMEKFDKVYNLKMAENEKLQRTKANIESLIQQLIAMQKRESMSG